MNRAGSSNNVDATSVTLIQRVKTQDAVAWEQFANLYGPLVYRWARKSGLQDSDAADVMQEVFRSVAVGVAKFRKKQPRDTFRGWLYTITRNAIRKHCNRQQKQPGGTGGTDAQLQMQQVHDLDDDAIDSVDFNSEASLTHRSLQLISNEFEQRTWQAFWRLVVEGHSAAEIGEDLQMKPGAVRQAKYRVLCRVREMLADQ